MGSFMFLAGVTASMSGIMHTDLEKRPSGTGQARHGAAKLSERFVLHGLLAVHRLKVLVTFVGFC